MLYQSNYVQFTICGFNCFGCDSSLCILLGSHQFAEIIPTYTFYKLAYVSALHNVIDRFVNTCAVFESYYTFSIDVFSSAVYLRIYLFN